MKYLFLITVLLSCKSGPRKVIAHTVKNDTTSQISVKRDATSVDIHDPYEAGKDTVRVNAAMDKILKFPEVEAINKQINKASEGAHGVSFMVEDDFEGDTTFYHFIVGDNSHEDKYLTIFHFLLEKKTGRIKVYDTVMDSIMNLKDWRKTRK